MIWLWKRLPEEKQLKLVKDSYEIYTFPVRTLVEIFKSGIFLVKLAMKWIGKNEGKNKGKNENEGHKN